MVSLGEEFLILGIACKLLAMLRQIVNTICCSNCFQLCGWKHVSFLPSPARAYTLNLGFSPCALGCFSCAALQPHNFEVGRPGPPLYLAMLQSEYLYRSEVGDVALGAFIRCRHVSLELFIYYQL